MLECGVGEARSKAEWILRRVLRCEGTTVLVESSLMHDGRKWRDKLGKSHASFGALSAQRNEPRLPCQRVQQIVRNAVVNYN